MTDWTSRIDAFGTALLERLNESPYYLPTEYNPITRALDENPNLIEEIEGMTGFSKIAMSRVAVACQMSVYDANGGPDGDGDRKGLRRQWYAWYKTRFAIPLSNQLAERGDETEVKGFDGTLWAGRMSQTYSYFVDKLDVTYWDLWVTDSSRMMEKLWGSLVDGLHIVLAVEKDSLFGDFQLVAKGIGAQCLVSGKGKQSKAATEKMLRDTYDIQYRSPFSEANPLVVLHISDHDMDGEAVIGPTFGEQCRRYTSHVVEARVGIKPEAFKNERGGHFFDEEAVTSSWYEVKTTNNGYINWSASKALFMAECPRCGHKWIVEGINEHECPECWTPTGLAIKVAGGIQDQPMGFEVEALPTRKYYRLVVEALLEAVPFDWIVERLRAECQANHHQASEDISKDVFEANEDYQALLAEFDRLEAIKRDFEAKVKAELTEMGKPHVSDWEDEEDDPSELDFADYVDGMTTWDGAWRPFDKELRTELLKEYMTEGNEDYTERIEEMKAQPIEWAA
jgi:hypothetical protein